MSTHNLIVSFKKENSIYKIIGYESPIDDLIGITSLKDMNDFIWEKENILDIFCNEDGNYKFFGSIEKKEESFFVYMRAFQKIY